MAENDQIERNFRVTNNNAVDMHVGKRVRLRRDPRTYAMCRGDIRYRYSMFKAQARRRNKRVELQRREYEDIVRRPCLYCGSTHRIGIDRAQNHLHYTHANSVPCCASCNFMKERYGSRTLRSTRCLVARLGVWSLAQAVVWAGGSGWCSVSMGDAGDMGVDG